MAINNKPATTLRRGIVKTTISSACTVSASSCSSPVFIVLLLCLSTVWGESLSASLRFLGRFAGCGAREVRR